jgi:hypothetical protein
LENGLPSLPGFPAAESRRQRERRAESTEQIAEGRESGEQKAESREQRAAPGLQKTISK